MTVTYSEGISLITKWHGSVWKAAWKDLVVWILLYYIVRIVLIYAPANEEQRKVAVDVVKMFNTFSDKIPVSFLLGFYVVQVVTRWWSQVFHVTWPDEIMVITNGNFPQPEKKHIRQSVARWLVLCQAMVFRKISKRIRRRFPQMESLVVAGLVTNEEVQIIKNTRCVNNRWQLPLQWIVNSVIVPSDLQAPTKVAYIAAINKFADAQRNLYVHDWIGIPLVYPQTCSVVVYGYFIFCTIGHQYIAQPVDLYVPVLTILQLIFYIGWYRVGKDLLRPFGEDDDDLELNVVLDRNAAVAMNLADEVAEQRPTLIEDPDKQREFVERMMNSLAYSKASLKKDLDRLPKMRSVVKIGADQQEMILPTTLPLQKKMSLHSHSETFHHQFAMSLEQSGSNRNGLRKIRKPPNLF